MKKEVFYDLAAELEKECGDWENAEGLSKRAREELLAKVAQMDREETERKRTAAKHVPVKKRYLLVLAAVLVLVMGIGVVGDRAWISDKEDVERASEISTKIDNEDKESVLAEEEEIYQEISEVLGIAALRLGYCPKGMRLDGYYITEDTGWAYVNYLYEGETITIQMAKDYNEVSGNVQWDGAQQKLDKIINEYGYEIDVYCVDEENHKYDAKLLYGNGYYEIFGCFSDENEFFSILSHIFFKNV